MNKKHFHPDFVLGSVAALLGIYVITTAQSFPKIPKRFPTIFGIALLLLSLIIIIEAVQKVRRGAVDDSRWKETRHALITGGIILLYAIGIDVVGFYIATTVFMLGCMFYMGVRNWKPLLLCTVGTNLAVWLIFSKFLGVVLP